MRFRWLVLAGSIVVGLVLVFSACSGDDDNGDGPAATQDAVDAGGDDGGGDVVSGNIDPCGLITAADAEEFLGEAVGESEKSRSGPYSVCTYNAADDLSFKFLIVQVREGVSSGQFREERDASERVLGIQIQEVDDVGEAAYDLGGLLFVHQSNRSRLASAVKVGG